MHTSRILHQRTINCLVCLLLFSGTAYAQSYRTGTVKSVLGEVAVERDGTRSVARVGDAIAEGDRIATGPNSAAAFALQDGTAIAVGPSSIIDLTNYRYDAKRQEGSMFLKLVGGSLRFITGLLGKHNPDQVRIATRTTTLGIRGTDFILEAP